MTITRSLGRAGRWRGARRSGAGTGALLVLAAGLVLGGPAPAADAAACSSSTGVTVVVDFGSLGGGVRTSCAGSPGSGLSALVAAGHSYTFVPRFVGLVCQIDARPNPCNGAPSTAYWSYWHAERGKQWSYSQEGAGTYHPLPGTVEGWAFGAGRQPGIAPPAAPAPPPPAPKPTTKPAPKPAPQPPAPPPGSAPRGGAPAAPGTSAGTGAARGTGPGSAAGAATTRPNRTTAAPSTSAGPTATDGVSASATGAGGAPSTSDPEPPGSAATEPAGSSSKTLGAFSLAVALIAALGLAGFLIARRRRAGPPI